MKPVLRLLSFLLLIVLFFLPLWVTNLISRQAGSGLLQIFYRLVRYCWGIRVEVEGELSASRPLLLVSNHCSYLDVPVLGSLIPLRFTPKQEVRGWPLIGYLCEMASCIFIDRRRGKTSTNRENLLKVLRQGTIISLFPEGTTNDGSAPLPFKSSFLSLAEENMNGMPLQVQPIAVQYFRCDGEMLSRVEMDKVAWYGDAEFVPHLWEYFKSDGVLVRLQYHPPVTMEDCNGDRKLLTQRCEAVIRDSLR